MESPMNGSALKKEIEFALQEDENLIWAERRSYTVDADVGAVLGGGVLLLALSGFFAWKAALPGAPDYCNEYTISLSFIAALGCLFTAFYSVKTHGRTIYALTEQRALIVQIPPFGKPVIYAIPIAHDMVYRVSTHSDGSIDYYMAEIPFGRHNVRDYGFLRVQGNDSLHTELKRLGVELPQPGESHTAPHRLDAYRGISPLLPMVGWLAILALMLAGAGMQLSEPTTRSYLDFSLHGEKATATIIGYKKVTINRTTIINGKRGNTTTDAPVYHPIYRFRLPNGSTCQSVETVGAAKPKLRPGEQASIYYFPQQPEHAMRRNLDNFSMPLIFLGMGGVCIYMFLNACRRWSRAKNQPYYLIAPDK
ncbi:MAG: DUF3592 domain-containing protein [Akkermansia sp.]|nr:DUF3592 domain-containing protein [Akkermansia sp.]